jgi:hypothetical protein
MQLDEGQPVDAAVAGDKARTSTVEPAPLNHAPAR